MGESGEGGEGIRLQKVLAEAGVASRRQAEILMRQGRVEVDGKDLRVWEVTPTDDGRFEARHDAAF